MRLAAGRIVVVDVTSGSKAGGTPVVAHATTVPTSAIIVVVTVATIVETTGRQFAITANVRRSVA
jgi:hypothetical protein